MPSRDISAFFLGTIADLDPNESNYTAENAGGLLGTTFGSSASPLVDSNLDTLTLIDANGDNLVYDNDLGSVPGGEGLSYAGTFARLDSTIEYIGTVTFTDGSSVSTGIVLLQDELGRVFITPGVIGSPVNDDLDNGPIESIRLDSGWNANREGVQYALSDSTFVTCFCSGTRLDGPRGPVAVEALRPGDVVHTVDHGVQPILWISRSRPGIEDKDAPVCVARDALCPGVPARDVWLSPNHRVLLRSAIVERMFGVAEVLIAVKRLVGMPGITNWTRPRDGTRYFHILMERHELLVSAGMTTESLLLGPMVQRSMPHASKLDHTPVRMLATGNKARKLVERHAKNAKALMTPLASTQRALQRNG